MVKEYHVFLAAALLLCKFVETFVLFNVESHFSKTNNNKLMQTIDITTTQNVTIQYELASLRDRVVAFIIDFLLVCVALMIIFLIFSSAFGFERGNFFEYLISIPTILFYTLLFEYFNDGQTPGKLAIGIKVIKLDGKSPTFSDYLTRWAFRSVDIYLSIGSIAALLISSSDKGQRLGDITANTTLIKIRFNLRFSLEDIESISTLEEYEPKYPEVRRLNEEDLLLIKEVIIQVQRYPNKAHLKVQNDLVADLIQKLELDEVPNDNIVFLKTLIKDYIVLTR